MIVRLALMLAVTVVVPFSARAQASVDIKTVRIYSKNQVFVENAPIEAKDVVSFLLSQRPGQGIQFIKVLDCSQPGQLPGAMLQKVISDLGEKRFLVVVDFNVSAGSPACVR